METAQRKPVSTGSQAPRAVCPLNGRSYREVSLRTVLHHVTEPWRRGLAGRRYYFCTDPDCEVVYFAADATLIRRNELRTVVGQKSTDPQRLICYCFGVTAADLLTPATGGHDCRGYVVERTRCGDCDCAIRNPSGRCCLGDFPALPDSLR